eukprot:TRINITY_DN41060_c0_g1_i1.p1 TRINITY_DN41060_c0_g1~~TRINITY_DN41060_c0_g1_i1.p1  ORF type:complete len:279 (+),score=12.60 TRINITY_DN41060_c0_g1_i1:29-838(+)
MILRFNRMIRLCAAIGVVLLAINEGFADAAVVKSGSDSQYEREKFRHRLLRKSSDGRELTSMLASPDNHPKITCAQRGCVRVGCDVHPRQGSCCSEHIFDALVSIVSWLDANNYEYVLSFGTLLGAVRNQTIIPWTSDIDIILLHPEAQKTLLSLERGALPFTFFVRSGVLRACSKDPKGQPRTFTFRYSSPSKDSGTVFWSVDLFQTSSKAVKRVGPICLERSKNRTVTINGREFNAPDDVHGCCKQIYGSDYMTPKEGNNGNDRAKL